MDLKKAHFGDISYNVFNRRKPSYYMLETIYFTILSQIDNFNDDQQQKLIIAVYIHSIYKKPICEVLVLQSTDIGRQTYSCSVSTIDPVHL